ncbi:MAG: DUF5360 family protein [Spirochaetales bacterium]
MTKPLKGLLLFTDVGFVVYWMATALHWIPPEWAYQDYSNPLLVSWNWSFLPLDLAVSAFGLTGFALARRRPELASRLVLVSLALTVSSGLNALSFWAFRGEFDAAWWLANGFLLVWPLPFLVRFLRRS